MAKFYGVKAGREIGVYKTWDECVEQVKGFSGADYKSFKSEQEANDFVYGVTVVKKERKLDSETKDELEWLIDTIKASLAKENIQEANMYLDNLKDALDM
ncbi:MAG: RNase H1/viroplasmin domain-containing protein [Cellulosilyticaceae bacterium]